MKYVELLSRLKPATSPYVGNHQNLGDTKLSADDRAKREAAKKSRCLCCRGRKRIKVPPVEVGGSPAWEVCPRCFGSGRYVEGNQKSSRPKGKPETMPHELIAGLTKDMPDHIYRAAVVFATHDISTMDRLVGDISREIVIPRSDAWQIPKELRTIRALGLARVAAHTLMQPNAEIDSRIACLLMCCTKDNWNKTWSGRGKVVSERTFSWVKAANAHMRDMREMEYDEVG